MQTEYKWKICQTCGGPTTELNERRGQFEVACSRCDAEPQNPSKWDAVQWGIRAKKHFELMVHGQDGSVLTALYGKRP